MKLITLLENTASRCDLTAEHGLSLYIETNGRKILFDAGQTGAFADNAERLGVDLSSVELAVLSHAHYDHGGGLLRFREINPAAPVYLSRYAFTPSYNAKGKYLGIPPALCEDNCLIFTEGETRLAEGITLHTIPLLPTDTAGMTVVENGVNRPEDFRHEQYLLVEEQGKRILFSGCSHKGILQIVKWFRPDVLIGGFHFMNLEEEAFLTGAAQQLGQYDTIYYTGHCTGQKQFAVLKQTLGDRLHSISAGTEMEI